MTFICPICGKRFSRYPQLVRHAIVHIELLDDSRIRCPCCGRVYTARGFPHHCASMMVKYRCRCHAVLYLVVTTPGSKKKRDIARRIVADVAL